MDPLLDLARARNLRVVEDCAQAHLTEYKGRKVGALGDVGCFSFYVTKNLGAAGDAGLCLTNDPELDRRLRMLRNNGSDPKEKYLHPLRGYNARLDELQAALLRVKLTRLAKWTAERRSLADLYRRELDGLPLALPPAGAEPHPRHARRLDVDADDVVTAGDQAGRRDRADVAQPVD
jgi:dTDP-4-amino-4,6-dideoxygalactose transaminase